MLGFGALILADGRFLPGPSAFALADRLPPLDLGSRDEVEPGRDLLGLHLPGPDAVLDRPDGDAEFLRGLGHGQHVAFPSRHAAIVWRPHATRNQVYVLRVCIEPVDTRRT